MSHASPTEAASEAKFRLAGKVAGIDACQLISDCDEVVVGSALNCDLIVTDPLVPLPITYAELLDSVIVTFSTGSGVLS